METANQLDLMGERVGSMMILDPGWIHPERSEWYRPNKSAAEPSRLLRFLRKPDKARKIYFFVRERYRKLTAKRRHRRFIEDLSDYHKLAVDAFTTAAQDYAPAQSPCGIDLLLTADWEFGNVSWPDRLARWKQVATDRITIHPVPGRHAHSFENETAVEVGQVVERILRNAE